MRFSFLPPLALLAAVASPAAAQYIGAAPPPPAAPLPGTVETPAAALARNVRLLALAPKNFSALMAAGRAELDLGDLEAAIGFFGRADEVRPSDPGPKIGMGAATTLSGDARGALAWFGQAQSLGASAAVMGADRGLAHDLLGELSAAQADYRAALMGASRDEARRRLALSLAIGGQMSEALGVLQPLLNSRDPAAQRVRAFVLALGGDQAQAGRAIELAMPGSAARVGPFFALLPRLTTEQKAAAVHLGVFPTAGEVKLAAVTPPPPQPTPRRTAAVTLPKTVTHRSKGGKATVRYETIAPPVETAPIENAPTRIASNEVAAPPRVIPPAPQPRVEAAPQRASTASPGFSTSVIPATGDRLSGIDRILAASAEGATPDKLAAKPGRPPGRTSDTKAADKKAAAAKKAAADKKAADEKQAAEDRKAKEAAAKLGVSGTHWVQLAGGSNQERMATEYKRIKAKKAALFAGHPGYVTGGKDYFRLLVGPFDDSDDARDYVNKLAKAGIDGFSWTRTPAQIKIEKLPSK